MVMLGSTSMATSQSTSSRASLGGANGVMLQVAGGVVIWTGIDGSDRAIGRGTSADDEVDVAVVTPQLRLATLFETISLYWKSRWLDCVRVGFQHFQRRDRAG